MKRALLKRYKNELHRVIEESDVGVAPSDFQTEEVRLDSRGNEMPYDPLRILAIGTHVWFRVLYDENMYFRVRHINEDFHTFHCRYIRFEPRFMEEVYESLDFLGVKNKLHSWLAVHLKPYHQELNRQNIWDRAQSLDLLVTEPAGTTTSEPLDETQTEYIEKAAKELKERIVREFSPTTEQVERIEGQLDYLVGAAGRLTFKDFRLLLIATTIQIISTLSLSGGRAEDLAQMVMEAFNQVLQLPH